AGGGSTASARQSKNPHTSPRERSAAKNTHSTPDTPPHASHNQKAAAISRPRTVRRAAERSASGSAAAAAWNADRTTRSIPAFRSQTVPAAGSPSPSVAANAPGVNRAGTANDRFTRMPSHTTRPNQFAKQFGFIRGPSTVGSEVGQRVFRYSSSASLSAGGSS